LEFIGICKLKKIGEMVNNMLANEGVFQQKNTAMKEFIHAALERSVIKEKFVYGVKVVDCYLSNALRMTSAVYGVNIRDLNNSAAESGEPRSEIYSGNYECEIAGLEGPLAVSIFLYSNTWMAMRSWTMGPADFGDLTIFYNNVTHIADVKMRTKPEQKCFRLTFKQWRKHAYDLYISCQYPSEEKDFVRILGYIEREKIDLLVSSEIKRLLGKPLQWTYEGLAAEKHVSLTDDEFKKLINSLRNSPEINKIKENEVGLGGIGDLGYGPEIAIPFNELSPIVELKEILGKH
jgi:hypothetical protein